MTSVCPALMWERDYEAALNNWILHMAKLFFL